MSAYVCEDKTIQRIIGYLHTAATGNQTHQNRVRGEIDTISCGGLDEETLPAPMTDERGAVIQAAYKKMKDLAEQVAKQFLIEHGVPEGVLTVQWPGEVVLPGDHRQILS